MLNNNENKITVELTREGILLRIIFMVIFLGVASYAFYSIFTYLFRTEPGWRKVEIRKPATTAGEEIEFNYNFGVSGMGAAEEWMRLNRDYPGILEYSYRTFSIEEYPEVKNLHEINSHPNETVTVEEDLYAALEMISAKGSRYPFYAPLHDIYRGLFGCENDVDASNFDIALDPGLKEYAGEVLSFASDPEHAALVFQGDGKVMLKLSQEYMEFAENNEIGVFIDLFFWKNAFVLDSAAKVLTEKGYTAGILTCREGFCRMPGEGEYSLDIFDRTSEGTYKAATMGYGGNGGIVSLYTFPVSAEQAGYYYVYDDGSLRNPFMDAGTGLCLSENKNLTAYSGTLGCGEILVKIWESFISPGAEYNTDDSQDINTVYIHENVIHKSEENAELKDVDPHLTVYFR